MTARAFQRPTTIPIDQPIAAPIPAGKRIAYIDCGLATCTSYVPVIEEAVASFGWSVTSISTDGSPAGIKNAWTSIFRQNYDGVIYAAVERSVIDNELREAQRRGIPVAALNVMEEATDGITFIAGDRTAARGYGEVAAAYVVAESGGRGKAVVFNVPGVPIIGPITAAFQQSVHDECQACDSETVDIPVSAIGKDAPDRIAAYLRSHPRVEYVFLTAGGLVPGLPAALRAVGIRDKHLLTPSSDPAVMDMVAKGDIDAAVSFDSYGYFYAMADALARFFAGVPQINRVSVQNWIIRRDDVMSRTERFPFVADMREQYAVLWARK
ncbi:substrate-binding domain-containing protein [Nocardia sp. R6R-6]|uniref:substrate-binding domain-containing protein n=1 Tax=Nocardia sp. R6R-6 TaxID=3459303 RepID=UPI00403DE688